MIIAWERMEEVLADSKHVGIRIEGIANFVEQFDDGWFTHWLSISPFAIDNLDEREKLHFLVLLNAISFCYWGEPKWEVEFEGNTYDGAQAMMTALGKAYQQSSLLLEPRAWMAMRREELEHILRGNVEIPLLDERLAHVREVGAVLFEQFDGSFMNVINEARGNTAQLVLLLSKRFPSFQDYRVYQGQRIDFSKRAQLLTSDIAHMFPGLIKGVHELSACADYKLPQVLRRYGVLEYSEELQQHILAKKEIEEGSEYEVAIRAATVLAVEQIKEQFLLRGKEFTSMEVNDYIWLLGQKKLPQDERYHRTRTTSY